MTEGGAKITITMISRDKWRICFGDDQGGQYAIADAADIWDYLTSKRPHAELIDLYNLRGDDGTNHTD